jgi:hypothetical protein
MSGRCVLSSGGKTIVSLLIFVGTVIGLAVAYLVQFKLIFFGANFITIENIIFLWAGVPFLIVAGLLFLFGLLSGNKFASW